MMLNQNWPPNEWTWVMAPQGGLVGPAVPVRVEPLRLPEEKPLEAPAPAKEPEREKVPA